MPRGRLELKNEGQADESAAELEYEPDQGEEYQAGSACEVNAAPDGLPLPHSCEGDAGQAGHRASEVQGGDICSRLLLAPPSRVQELHDAYDQSGVLGDKVGGERGEGQATPGRTAAWWVACRDGVGVRN